MANSEIKIASWMVQDYLLDHLSRGSRTVISKRIKNKYGIEITPHQVTEALRLFRNRNNNKQLVLTEGISYLEENGFEMPDFAREFLMETKKPQ